MANFGKNHGVTPLKKYQSFDCLESCFNSLETPFYDLEYHKTHFPGLYCLKKWQILNQNYGLTPMEKSLFFHFLNFLFYSLEKSFLF